MAGIVGYGAVLLVTLEGRPDAAVAVAARLVFILITVGAALLAINLMRKRGRLEDRRRERMRVLLLISQTLNTVTSDKELPQILQR